MRFRSPKLACKKFKTLLSGRCNVRLANESAGPQASHLCLPNLLGKLKRFILKTNRADRFDSPDIKLKSVKSALSAQSAFKIVKPLGGLQLGSLFAAVCAFRDV